MIAKLDLLAFARAVVAECLEDADLGSELGYDTFLLIGQEHGVLRCETYDPAIHGTAPGDEWGLEPGDDIYLSNLPPADGADA